MENIDIFYILFIAELILISMGMFFWGYRSGVKIAMRDMKKILDKMMKENGDGK